MKRIVFAAVALSMVAAVAPLNSADAADMAVKAPTTFGPAPIGLWEGVYIGGNGGYARSSTSWCTDATVVTGCGGAPTDQVSKKAWSEWIERQKMLLNEYRLQPWTREAQEFLVEQMQEYFFGEGSALPKEYVPPAH